MKINVNFIYSFLIIILISFVIIEFHNSNVLESRINTITKNNKPLNSDKTFKEDYYITQQSHDTNLILVVFTVLIAFTGLFTYVNIIERYNAKVSEIKDDVEKYKSEYDEKHRRLVKLELDLYFQITINYRDYAKKVESENDIKGYLIISMCSMKKYAQVIQLSDNEVYKKRILNTLNTIIDYDYFIIKDMTDFFQITDLDSDVLKTRIANISQVLDSDNLQMFSFIVSRLKLS